MRPYFNSRGRRGRGAPQIYKSLRQVHFDSSAIFDHRFSNNAPSASNSHLTEGCDSASPITDPFQDSLNEFVRAAQLARETAVAAPPSSSSKNPKEFPQDKRYFCDKCFRGYDTKFMFNRHLESHVKCTYEGCKFEANPWALAKHIMNLHNMKVGTGLNYAADKRWIEERKRKFPSQSAMKEKELSELAKNERGEVIASSSKFGKFKISESENFKQYVERRIDAPHSEEAQSNHADSCSMESQKSVKLSWFNDPEGETSEPIPDKLKNLLDQAEQQSVVNKNTRNFSGRSDTKKPSLLEMLLKDDIVHERNVLLQCIRYIVSKNFFETH